MKIVQIIILFFMLTSFINAGEISNEDLKQLSGEQIKVHHFFFYSKKLKKSFLFTKNSSGKISLYYFRNDGKWEPVSNAPSFRGFPSASNKFDSISYDQSTSIVSFGNYINSLEENQNKSIQKNIIKNSIVNIKTNMGDIKVKLFDNITPKTVENFLYLSEHKKYDSLIFHRVIKGFMIQGGDPKGDGTGGMSKWGKSFEDEFSDKVNFDKPYMLAMANSGPNTNGSQFFITAVPTVWLNGKHSIFGEVIDGKDIVDKISRVKVGKNNKPIDEVKIITITVEK